MADSPHDPLSAPWVAQEAPKTPWASSHPTSPVEHVPSELSAEFERRVQALMARWRRLYAAAGVPDLVNPDTDRHIAEWRVGREMGLL